MDVVALLKPYLSEIVSGLIGILAGATVTYTVTKSNRASTGGAIVDLSGSRTGGDMINGDKIGGDKVGGNKVLARDINVNR